MRLSILICTVPQRAEMLSKLLNEINTQRVKTLIPTEVISDACMDITTGEKRNRLLEKATGDYTVFIDDDDEIPEYYIEEIIQATEVKPDCVGMRGYMTTDGQKKEPFEISIKHNYNQQNGVYLRYPNHITPIASKFTKQVRFPNQSLYEDYEWSMALKNMDLLKKEVFIDKDMYHYKYSTQNKLY